MIKLTELLKEEESFTATSKKSGETAVFKSKDARDAAVKAGTHSNMKDSDDGDDKKDTPKVNIFDKPKNKEDEPKKDEPVRDENSDMQIQDVSDNIDDLEQDEIAEYAESDIFPYLKGKDLELAQSLVDDIENASGGEQVLRDDLKDLFDKKMTLESVNESSKRNESTKLSRLVPESIINEGTRSQVGIIDRSGKIASAYVHYDGYPSNMKPGLKKHMKNEKDVLDLIKRGGASGIYNDKDIKYYDEKSSPIKGDLKTLSRYFKSASSSGGAEFVYLYNMKDKKWYYADTYEDNELKKLF